MLYIYIYNDQYFFLIFLKVCLMPLEKSVDFDITLNHRHRVIEKSAAKTVGSASSDGIKA